MNQGKWLRAILSLTVGIGATLFFGLAYPHHIHFQEQYQLFLFDMDYAAEVLSVPGGFADYIGRFLTQFFLFAWAGAAVWGVLLGGITWLLTQRLRGSALVGLALVPVAVLWVWLCDENALAGGIVAFCLALLSAQAVTGIRSDQVRGLTILLAGPMLYVLIGPVALLFILSVVVRACQPTEGSKPARWSVVAGLASLAIVLLLPLLLQYAVAVPLERLYTGVHYYRSPYDVPTLLWVAAGVAWIVEVLPLLPLALAQPMPDTAPKMQRVGVPAVFAVVMAAMGGWAVSTVYNPQAEVAMSYDYMARFQQWNRIVQTAHQRLPNNQMSATVLNLALCMKGQLADHAFEYNQNGIEGLLPHFQRDPVSPMPTSEAYYQLGMINTAQRFVFEAQEAIPDFQKSGRCYKRLAETNLINGAYPVAHKYLLALKKTLFYSQWATETERLLGDEKAIARHQEYGRLRQYKSDNDYHYSDSELSQMLGRQCLANRQNRVAFEYLEMSYLLQHDIDNFVRCLNLGQSIGYQQMPLHFQQALLLWFSRDHTAQEQMPAGIRQDVIMGLNQFYGMARGGQGGNEERLFRQFGNSYWYYYFYQK